MDLTEVEVKYEIKFNIETDGDFDFVGSEIKAQYAPTPEEAFKSLIVRMYNAVITMHGNNDLIVSKVTDIMHDMIKEAEELAEASHEECYLNFESGNHSGEFEINKVKVYDTNGIETILKGDSNED